MVRQTAGLAPVLVLSLAAQASSAAVIPLVDDGLSTLTEGGPRARPARRRHVRHDRRALVGQDATTGGR